MIFMVGLSLSFLSNNVWGENLKEYSRDKDGTVCYYDLDSVKKSSGQVKVWVTIMYGDNDTDRDEIISVMKKYNQCQGCERLSYSKSLYEIRCREDMSRTNTFIHYDTDGRALYTNETQAKWRDIVPGTIIDKLKKRVCK